MNKILFYNAYEENSNVYNISRVISSKTFTILPGEHWMIIMPDTYNVHKIEMCCERLIPTTDRLVICIQNISTYNLHVPYKTPLSRLIEMPTIIAKHAQIQLSNDDE
jgi:hypothetical protein